MKEKPVLLLMFIGVPKLVPLLLLAAKKISLLPGVESSHVTYTLLPDVAICGLKEPPVLLLMFIGVPKLVPLLLLTAKKISELPGVESSHVTYTLLPDVAICGFTELPVLLLMFIGVPKLVPLLLLTAKKISLLPGVVSSHVT